jgi:hypothetical protein
MLSSTHWHYVYAIAHLLRTCTSRVLSRPGTSFSRVSASSALLWADVSATAQCSRRAAAAAAKAFTSSAAAAAAAAASTCSVAASAMACSSPALRAATAPLRERGLRSLLFAVALCCAAVTACSRTAQAASLAR